VKGVPLPGASVGVPLSKLNVAVTEGGNVGVGAGGVPVVEVGVTMGVGVDVVAGVEGMDVAEFVGDGFGVAEAVLSGVVDVKLVGVEVGLVVDDDVAKGEGVWVRDGEGEGATTGALLEKYHRETTRAAITIAAIKIFDQVGSFKFILRPSMLID
jgi:hypothetical protein